MFALLLSGRFDATVVYPIGEKCMRTLPYDWTRCAPQKVDDKCRNCRRWFNHPEQKNHPMWQSCVTVETSKSKACMHTPISLLEDNHD